MRVKDIYRENPVSIAETATIKEAIEMFIKNGSNGVLVINDKQQLVGILSLQDIVAGIVPVDMREHSNLAQSMYRHGFFKEAAEDIADNSVKELMRKDFMVADPETNLMEVAVDFLRNDLYIVPVVENKKLIGVVSRSEIKAALASAMNIKKDK